MSKVVITRNFQITIPKEIRTKLKLKLGDQVILRVEGDRIVGERSSDEVWDECTDFLPDNFEKIRARLREDATKRFQNLGIF